MSGHTPGPWKAYPEALFNGTHVAGRCPIVRAGYLRIARVDRISISSRKMDQEGEFNARLIAAAPDLLEACREVLDTVEEWPGELEQKVRAAIAKAEGTA